MRRIIKEKDDIKVSIFNGCRLARVFIDSGYMYAGDYYPHRSHMYNFGKRVKDIDSLPKKVIEFIKYITR